MYVVCSGRLTSEIDYKDVKDISNNLNNNSCSDGSSSTSNGSKEGKKQAEKEAVSNPQEILDRNMKTSKFVTDVPIPPMSLGIFVGYVDAKFNMPLYRCIGKVWKASAFASMESLHPMEEQQQQQPQQQPEVPSTTTTTLPHERIIDEQSIHLNFYEKKVKKTLLGLDQACKHVHKYVGRCYQHKTHTQVSSDIINMNMD